VTITNTPKLPQPFTTKDQQHQQNRDFLGGCYLQVVELQGSENAFSTPKMIFFNSPKQKSKEQQVLKT